MFERYTETARKAVFFARYEASLVGSPYIETDHLLLGILRADGPLALRLLKAPGKIASIRAGIEQQSPGRKRLSTSVDLPLSQECRRVLTYGAQESERLAHKHIATEHLLLGLLREEKCAAAKIMLENGLTSPQLEQEVIQLSPAGTPVVGPVHDSPPPEVHRDLTAAARRGTLSPLIGRERELERIIQILARRTKNNPVLIGEPGVGKNALVHGLAQRIADGVVPAILEERPILVIDASSLLSSGQGEKFREIANRANAILYIRGLFDLAGKGTGWGVLEAVRVLELHLMLGLQCIATGAAAERRRDYPHRSGREGAVREISQSRHHAGSHRNGGRRLALVSQTPSSAGSCH